MYGKKGDFTKYVIDTQGTDNRLTHIQEMTAKSESKMPEIRT